MVLLLASNNNGTTPCPITSSAAPRTADAFSHRAPWLPGGTLGVRMIHPTAKTTCADCCGRRVQNLPKHQHRRQRHPWLINRKQNRKQHVAAAATTASLRRRMKAAIRRRHPRRRNHVEEAEAEALNAATTVIATAARSDVRAAIRASDQNTPAVARAAVAVKAVAARNQNRNRRRAGTESEKLSRKPHPKAAMIRSTQTSFGKPKTSRPPYKETAVIATMMTTTTLDRNLYYCPMRPCWQVGVRSLLLPITAKRCFREKAKRWPSTCSRTSAFPVAVKLVTRRPKLKATNTVDTSCRDRGTPA